HIEVRSTAGKPADDVRAAADRGQLHALADGVADPGEALGGYRGTGGSDRPQARQVECLTRLQSGLHPGEEDPRTHTEDVDLRLCRDLPQPAGAGVEGTAVEADGGRACQQR